jgi:hypothetical protein
MAVVKCPSCGTAINVAEKKTGLWWGIGCLVAVCALPVLLFFVGLVSAIALPAFAKARDAAQTQACVSNMRQLSAAKEQFVSEKGCKPGDVIADQDLSTYLSKGVGQLKCPKGGHYTLSPAGEAPACSVHGPLTAWPRTYGSGGNR